MAVSKEMPYGQFVGLWEYKELIWSATFKRDIASKLYEYNSEEDMWELSSFPSSSQKVIAYITLDKEYLK